MFWLYHRLPVAAFLSILALVSCTASKPDYQQIGERFLETYYLQADPKEALNLTLDPASEKLNHEMDLLKGIPASHSSEQPKMSYKILSCDLAEPQLAQCRYQLDIQMDRTRVRRGLLTLRPWKQGWKVTQFVEEPYESGNQPRIPLRVGIKI